MSSLNLHHICRLAKRWARNKGRVDQRFASRQVGRSWPCSLCKRRWSWLGCVGGDFHPSWWASALIHLVEWAAPCKSHLGWRYFWVVSNFDSRKEFKGLAHLLYGREEKYMIRTSFLHFRNSKLPYKAIRLPLSVQRTHVGLRAFHLLGN